MEMLVVAEKWFGFQRGERLTVHVADGVTFINECVSANKHGKNFSCFLIGSYAPQHGWLYMCLHTFIIVNLVIFTLYMCERKRASCAY